MQVLGGVQLSLPYLVTLKKLFPEDFASMMLISYSSQPISQSRPEGIDCSCNAKLSGQWSWSLVRHKLMLQPQLIRIPMNDSDRVFKGTLRKKDKRYLIRCFKDIFIALFLLPYTYGCVCVRRSEVSLTGLCPSTMVVLWQLRWSTWQHTPLPTEPHHRSPPNPS